MAQAPTSTDRSEDVKALAEKIVEFETKDKGLFDKIFNFEARDGFWSKLAKVASITLSAFSTASTVTYLVAGPVGLVAAAAAAVVSAVIYRATTAKIISDMHDSQEGALGKFGHYAASNIVGYTCRIGASYGIELVMPGMGWFAAGVTSLVLENTLVPAMYIAASMGVSATLGNQKLIGTSAEAGEIARKAIESGQSVEQVMHHEHAVNTLASRAPSHGHEHGHGHRHDHGHGKHFAPMVEQQRATEHTHSI